MGSDITVLFPAWSIILITIDLFESVKLVNKKTKKTKTKQWNGIKK